MRSKRRFGVRAEDLYKEVTETLTSQGLLETGEGYLRLTDRGIEVSNLVMAEFLL